jgi:hypothetical protein
VQVRRSNCAAVRGRGPGRVKEKERKDLSVNVSDSENSALDSSSVIQMLKGFHEKWLARAQT